VPAGDLEAEAWRVVGATLLNREYLRVGLAEARKANREAARRRERNRAPQGRDQTA
jgi:hypothetical protein